MAHGENAEKEGRRGKEYWSPRLKGMWPFGRIAKHFTHRRERRETRRIEREHLYTNSTKQGQQAGKDGR